VGRSTGSVLSGFVAACGGYLHHIPLGYIIKRQPVTPDQISFTISSFTGVQRDIILTGMAKPIRRQSGRPPIGDTSMHQIALRLPKPMLAAIDEMLADRLDQPERSAIIRELLAEALAARKKRTGR
jgi:hypothetical protein